jgi:hypothetical protein
MQVVVASSPVDAALERISVRRRIGSRAGDGVWAGN